MAKKWTLLRNFVAFTASIEEQQLAVAPGTYIDAFALNYSGDLAATTTVAIETFLNLLNPFQFKIKGDVRISIRGRDLFGLNALYLSKTPGFFEGAAGEDDKVFGLQVPIWYTMAPQDVASWLATRVAVTNIATEEITVAYSVAEALRRLGYYHIVEITGTTPAVTGLFRAVDFLPAKGWLQGILFFSTTVPSVTAETTGVLRVQLFKDDVLEIHRTWADLAADSRFTGNLGTAGAFVDILANYRWLDLSEDPWDLRTSRVAIDIDSGVASEAFRIIPVYLVPSGAPAAR